MVSHSILLVFSKRCKFLFQIRLMKKKKIRVSSNEIKKKTYKTKRKTKKTGAKEITQLGLHSSYYQFHPQILPVTSAEEIRFWLEDHGYIIKEVKEYIDTDIEPLDSWYVELLGRKRRSIRIRYVSASSPYEVTTPEGDIFPCSITELYLLLEEMRLPHFIPQFKKFRRASLKEEPLLFSLSKIYAERPVYGLRCQLLVTPSRVRLFTFDYSQKLHCYLERTDNVPHLIDLFKKFPVRPLILEGYLVGKSFRDIHFKVNSSLPRSIEIQKREGLIEFHLSDILYYKQDLTNFPLSKRRSILEEFL